MRRAITAATEAAANHGCDEVDVVHMAVAVARDGESAACFLFDAAGVPRAAPLDRLTAVEPNGDRTRQRAARLPSQTLHVLDVAAGEADRWKQGHVGTEHVEVALTVARRRRRGPPRGRRRGLSMLFLDPPQHTRVRALFGRALTPRRLAGLHPRVQQITDVRFAEVLPTGRMDVIGTVAYPLPVIVIAELLGFPPDDYPLYKRWSDDFAAARYAAAARSRVELRAYFDTLADDPDRPAGDDLLSTLLAAGDELGALTRDELFINCALLLAAGHETTTNLIANGLRALLKHPDQLDRLRRDPTLIESAVDELLRFDSPVQWVSRVGGERLELSGVTLPPGAVLLGSIGSANRDDRQFADPDRLDQSRPDHRHQLFGSGVHFYLGAALARMEAEVAIGTLAQRCPNLRLTRRRPRWKKGLIFRAMRELPVRFDPVP